MRTKRALNLAVVVVLGAGVASAQIEWECDWNNPVLGPGVPGSWDDGDRSPAAVLKVDGVYHMFFVGWRPAYQPLFEATLQVGHATSADGIRWEVDPANPVLGPGAEGEWDHASIEGLAVIHDGTQFRMWYAAVDHPEEWFGGNYDWRGVGSATSSDGSSWTRHPGNPVIRAGGRIPRPVVPQTVIHDGERYRMWFIEPFGQFSGIGTAISSDGLFWTQAGPTVDVMLRDFPQHAYTGLSVVAADNVYHMLFAYCDGWCFEGSASSRDGLHWLEHARVQQPVHTGVGLAPRMLSDAGGFTVWSNSNSGLGVFRGTSQASPTFFTWFLPAAALGPGIGNSFYRTEVDVTNADEIPSVVQLVWFPRGEDNAEWIRSALYALDPRQSLRFADVLGEAFGLGPGSYGALAVEASSDRVVTMGRIHASSDDAPGANFAQAIAAVRIDDFLERGEHRRILLGREDAGSRFNLSCMNGSRRSSEVNLRLFDVRGTLLEERTMTLEAWSTDQINRVFGDHQPVAGWVEVWSESDRVYCFGSVLDNETNDPTTIPPM